MFAGNFAPRGWAFCDGQLLAVSQNDALFSLLGTIYGGDGRTTFGLPDMRGRIPIHAGHGPGLSERRLGAKAGAEDVTLTVNQLPSHSHALTGTATGASTIDPVGNAPAQGLADYLNPRGPSNLIMDNQSITGTGGGRSHTNMMPYLCVHFIIALVGIYPSQH